jgi:sugar/nucleoside kinase (ribokinase family)
MADTQRTVDLLCLGGASVDLLLQAPAVPAADAKLRVQFAGRVGGGLMANAACAAARLGVRTGWAGLLGSDDGARLLREDFNRFGVDTALAQTVAGQDSDFCVILLTPGGERTILIVNTLPSPPPLDGPTLAALERTRLVYCLPYALDWFEQVAATVHAGGGRVAVDIESATNLSGSELHQALSLSDMVFCDTSGLQHAAGTIDPHTGARALLAIGPQHLVVTLGSRGAWAFTHQEAQYAPAFKVPVVDSTGAGDCFHAAYLAGLLEGMPLAGRLRYASAAAALSVQGMGARGSLPDRNAVERFLAAESEILTTEEDKDED